MPPNRTHDMSVWSEQTNPSTLSFPLVLAITGGFFQKYNILKEHSCGCLTFYLLIMIKKKYLDITVAIAYF